MRQLVFLILFVIAVSISSPSAMAQKDSDSVQHKFDTFFGYTFTSTDILTKTDIVPANHSRISMNGGTADFTWNASRHVGIMAQFTGSFGSDNVPEAGSSDARVFSILFGPKVTHHAEQFDLFGQVLVGMVHATLSSPVLGANKSVSDTDFGMALGGGVDWVGTKRSHFAFRIIQVNYMVSQVFGSHSSHDRVSTGVIVRW